MNDTDPEAESPFNQCLRWKNDSSHWMNASMAACSCCWLCTAEAKADGAIEPVNAVPRITGNSEDTIEAGTPPEVRAPATDEVSSGGLSRLCVGVVEVVASIEDTEPRVPVRFGMDELVD